MQKETRDQIVEELAETVAEKLFEDQGVLYTFVLETLRSGFVGYHNLKDTELLKLLDEEISLQDRGSVE
jgi:hypothetical protein